MCPGPRNPKALVVYYSYEGNTKLTARVIASAIGADLLALKPRRPASPVALFQSLFGGGMEIMGERPELSPFSRDPQRYDLIFIGTPVWAWSYTPPVRSFLESVDLRCKHIALFCCHSGHEGLTLEKMRAHLRGSCVVGDLSLVRPLETNRKAVSKNIAGWAREMALKAEEKAP